MQNALSILLNGPVYHMYEVMNGKRVEADFWQKALKQKPTNREWQAFLEGRGYRGGVDYPVSFFYKYVRINASSLDNTMSTFLGI